MAAPVQSASDPTSQSIDQVNQATADGDALSAAQFNSDLHTAADAAKDKAGSNLVAAVNG
jgi:hypothetical protein